MNNLLPKSEGEFSEASYWEHFFKTRSNSFEWYGEYLSLVELFQKYVKVQDNILVVGCGNSTLSSDLYLTHKCKHVISIDTSSTVITQMLTKNKKILSPIGKSAEKTFDFICADASNLSLYETISKYMSLSCVIDKGTTDAIHSGGESSSAILESMWSAIEQCLAVMGRYILISLAQEHIVESIVNFFTNKKQTHGWMINVHEMAQSQTNNETFKLPVFAFVFYKMKASPSLPLVYIEENAFSASTNKSQKTVLKSPESELVKWTLSRQRLSMLCSTMKESGRNESEIDMVSPTTGLTRYHCVLVHNNQANDKKHSEIGMAYCVFIVPLGLDQLPIFDGAHSRRRLCRDQLKCGLCLFVYLNPREYYESKQSIQDEVHSVSLKLCPVDCVPRNYSIPVISSTENVCATDVTKSECSLLVTETVVTEAGVSSRRLVAPSSHRPVLMATEPLSCKDVILTHWLRVLSQSVGGPTVLYAGQPSCTATLHTCESTVLMPQYTAEARSFCHGQLTVRSCLDEALTACGRVLWHLIVSDDDTNDIAHLYTLLAATGVMIVSSAANSVIPHTLAPHVRHHKSVTESFARDVSHLWLLSPSYIDVALLESISRDVS